LYVEIEQFCLKLLPGLRIKLLSVILIVAPNFLSSLSKATNLSVSLIFSVCKPSKLHPIPKP